MRRPEQRLVLPDGCVWCQRERKSPDQLRKQPLAPPQLISHLGKHPVPSPEIRHRAWWGVLGQETSSSHRQELLRERVFRGSREKWRHV